MYLVYSLFKAIVCIVQMVGSFGSGWWYYFLFIFYYFSGFTVVSQAFDNSQNYRPFYGFLCLICSFGFSYYLIFTFYYAYKVRYLYYVAKHRELSNILQATQNMSKMANQFP